MLAGSASSPGRVEISPSPKRFGSHLTIAPGGARPYVFGAGITIANYEAAKDVQRFIIVRGDTTSGRLRVVLNWRADSAGPPAAAR